jgi:N-hydroxyarylamine O-acetyltransferase
VRQRRGGFCYELNGLFAWLLHQLGFRVTLLSARVANDTGSFGPDFDHLTLLVHQLDGADWLADVGFGDSFLQPIRFEAEVEQAEADGRKYRLQREVDENQENIQCEYWNLQQFSDEKWESQYRFTHQPRQLTDFTERCHYQQTSPESHFTQKRICSLATPTGRISLSDLRLITTINGNREERLLHSEEEYREVLVEKFGIVL